MSRFMAAHLASSLHVARDYLKRLGGLPHPVQPVDVQYPAWSALGHTIDFRLRLSLGRQLGPAVRLGVRLIGENGPLPGAPPPGTRAALYAAGEGPAS